ncbi:MAG: hypothetical protein COU65_04025 [Candidatus Pacebacteria bacterium CG10_big_fil_rev_8_21_14_0_10_42_12]|nr:D-alanyl-D-alanine carboxypeptidase [Candidatus Paceibacterota bacterium]PIR62340.1 MAG: hypothetical protein COU65_04025 [Candidatus Pacebacteria bacterium CG10_big_fil_rev_8_21_14_0_10_42_12]
MTERRRRLLGFVGVVLFAIGLCGYAALHWYIQHQEAAKILVEQRVIAPIPILNDPSAVPATISASAALVLDLESGSTLFEKGASARYAPASTTKLLTALVVRQHFPLDQIITVPYYRWPNGGTLGLVTGREYTIHNLLKAMLVTSANDVAQLFAVSYPGGEDAFVTEMNRLAQESGLSDSMFSNPAGFDFGDQYSTARDLAKLSKLAFEDQVLKEILATKKATIADVSGLHPAELVSTHKLLISDESVLGGKTGTTERAGEVLITMYQKNERPIVIVVLGSLDRYADTNLLTEWIYKNYTWIEPTPPHGQR